MKHPTHRQSHARRLYPDRGALFRRSRSIAAPGTVAVYDATSRMLGNGYSELFTHHAVEGTDASLVVELW